MIRQELTHGPSFRSPEYTFIGFSPLNKKEIAAVKFLPNAAPAGRAFGFFDPIHPAVFLVWNNGPGEDFFDLGPVIIAVPAGSSRVTFFPGAVFLLQQGERKTARYFGDAIVGRAWCAFLGKKLILNEKKKTLAPGSFVVKAPEQSPYLKIPYLLYFYLPLALIVILIAISGAGMAAAFFYYVGMFFLFDFKKLFVTVPLAWLFNALGVELPDLWIKVLPVILVLLFLAAGIYGLLGWKNREMPPSGKWIVLFFILLPFALFL